MMYAKMPFINKTNYEELVRLRVCQIMRKIASYEQNYAHV